MTSCSEDVLNDTISNLSNTSLACTHLQKPQLQGVQRRNHAKVKRERSEAFNFRNGSYRPMKQASGSRGSETSLRLPPGRWLVGGQLVHPVHLQPAEAAVMSWDQIGIERCNGIGEGNEAHEG